MAKPESAPRVLNKRFDKIPLTAIYVGRPTRWGNPYSHLAHSTAEWRVESRAAAIEAYAAWILTRPDLLVCLPELRGRDLVCWCSPAPCHANILLELANK